MDKLSRLDNQMQEHFGNLTTDQPILGHEMKQELDGVKKSLRHVEKSLEAAWDSINDRPAQSKPQKNVDSQQAEIENLKTSAA